MHRGHHSPPVNNRCPTLSTLESSRDRARSGRKDGVKVIVLDIRTDGKGKGGREKSPGEAMNWSIDIGNNAAGKKQEVSSQGNYNFFRMNLTTNPLKMPRQNKKQKEPQIISTNSRVSRSPENNLLTCHLIANGLRYPQKNSHFASKGEEKNLMRNTLDLADTSNYSARFSKMISSGMHQSNRTSDNFPSRSTISRPQSKTRPLLAPKLATKDKLHQMIHKSQHIFECKVTTRKNSCSGGDIGKGGKSTFVEGGEKRQGQFGGLRSGKMEPRSREKGQKNGGKSFEKKDLKCVKKSLDKSTGEECKQGLFSFQKRKYHQNVINITTPNLLLGHVRSPSNSQKNREKSLKGLRDSSIKTPQKVRKTNDSSTPLNWTNPAILNSAIHLPRHLNGYRMPSPPPPQPQPQLMTKDEQRELIKKVSQTIKSILNANLAEESSPKKPINIEFPKHIADSTLYRLTTCTDKIQEVPPELESKPSTEELILGISKEAKKQKLEAIFFGQSPSPTSFTFKPSSPSLGHPLVPFSPEQSEERIQIEGLTHRENNWRVELEEIKREQELAYGSGEMPGEKYVGEVGKEVSSQELSNNLLRVAESESVTDDEMAGKAQELKDFLMRQKAHFNTLIGK